MVDIIHNVNCEICGRPKSEGGHAKCSRTKQRMAREGRPIVARGRKKSVGKYETRKELEEVIWNKWLHSSLNQSQIAKFTQVSETTVSNILRGCAGGK